MEYIDSVCSDMFSPWVPKLLMDVFILSQHHENYNIIKHVNQDCLHRIYFDPQKYNITNQFQGEGYDLLCKDLATSAIKEGYQIVKNGFYLVSGLTANRFSCSRCIQYKGNNDVGKTTSYRQKSFHNDARNSRGSVGRKMCRRSITQRATQKTCKCKFFFSVQHDDFGFFLAPRVGNPQHCFHSKLTNDQIVFPPSLLNKETRSMIEKISKADGNHTIAANVVFHTTGIMLSNDNIAYLSGLCNDLEKIDKIKKQNSIEKIINYLKKKKYNHMVLYHNEKKSAH